MYARSSLCPGSASGNLSDCLSSHCKGCGFFVGAEQQIEHSGYDRKTDDKAKYIHVSCKETADLIDGKGYAICKQALVADCKPCPLSTVHFPLNSADGCKARCAQKVECQETVCCKRSKALAQISPDLRSVFCNFFEVGADEDIAAYTNPLVLPGMYATASAPKMDWEWSMVQYEEALASSRPTSEETVQEARDELEKSVVAHVADDVKVSIKGRTVEMIIIKKMV